MWIKWFKRKSTPPKPSQKKQSKIKQKSQYGSKCPLKLQTDSKEFSSLCKCLDNIQVRNFHFDHCFEKTLKEVIKPFKNLYLDLISMFAVFKLYFYMKGQTKAVVGLGRWTIVHRSANHLWAGSDYLVSGLCLIPRLSRLWESGSTRYFGYHRRNN